MRRRATGLALTLLAGASTLAPRPAEADPSRAEEPAAAILHAAGPAVVTLRGAADVLATYGGESFTLTTRFTALGMVVDPEGLVLTSDGATGGAGSPRLRALLAQVPGLELRIDVTSLRVVLGQGEETLEGEIVARDGPLDLAWVRIRGLDGRRLPAVDLVGGRDPVVGERIVGVGRLGQGFGLAPILTLGRVVLSGTLPRRAWAVTVHERFAGLPYFDEAGRPVGVLADVAAVGGEEGEGGGTVRARLLPLGTVRRSLDAVRRRIAALAEAEADAEGR